MHKRITSLMIFIAIVFGQQSKSGLELEESTIQGVLTVKLAIADSNVVQKLAIADAKEDFNSGLKWSALSMAAFIGGLFVVVTDVLTSNEEIGNLMGGTIAFAAPIYIIHKIPVDNSRLNNLLTKNEKHRNAYRTAYEKETRKQRLKYSLLATGSSTVAIGGLYVVVMLRLGI